MKHPAFRYLVISARADSCGTATLYPGRVMNIHFQVGSVDV